MKQRSALYGFSSILTVGILALGSFLAGCADNSTGPGKDTTAIPPGSDATVQVSDPVPADEAASVQSNVQTTSRDTTIISPQQAAAIAQSQNPSAQLVGVNLDYDQSTLVYECILRSSGRTQLVLIDPKTGAVLGKSDIANAYYTTVLVINPTFIQINEVRRKTQQMTGGTMVESNLEQIDGRPTYVVILLNSDRRYVTLYLDAESGHERKISDEDPTIGSGDLHKNKRGRGHYRHGKGHGYGHNFHCLFPDDDHNGGGGAQLPGGVITIDSARTIVRGMSSDSIAIVKTQIDIGNDSTVSYQITYAAKDSSIYQVTLDGYTGSLVEIRQTAGNFTTNDLVPKVKGDTLVALSVARTAALAAYAGTVKGWSLAYDKGASMWVYTFDVNGASGDKNVLINAKTGVLIRVE